MQAKRTVAITILLLRSECLVEGMLIDVTPVFHNVCTSIPFSAGARSDLPCRWLEFNDEYVHERAADYVRYERYGSPQVLAENRCAGISCVQQTANAALFVSADVVCSSCV